jgi:hypothetical protein
LKRCHEKIALQIILHHLFARGKYVYAPAVLTASQNYRGIYHYYNIEERRQKT